MCSAVFCDCNYFPSVVGIALKVSRRFVRAEDLPGSPGLRKRPALFLGCSLDIIKLSGFFLERISNPKKKGLR